jgi:uncharacterized membrane protein
MREFDPAADWAAQETFTERVLLWIVAVFSAAAVIGFATFGTNPELLQRFPWSVPVYAVSYRLFSIGQIALAGGALCLLLALRVRLRWILAFAAVYVISLASELSGTAFGFPFGPYYYTALLGPQWFDLVPWVIPLSWFMMAIPALAIALRVLPDSGPLVWIPLGAVVLTLWDLALDPAMSYATAYWRWEVDGAYYGMPWINLWGWIFTSLLIMGALAFLRADRWVREIPFRWLVLFYLVNLLLPLGMAAAAGLGWALVLTALGYGVVAGVVWLARSRQRADSRVTAP